MQVIELGNKHSLVPAINRDGKLVGFMEEHPDLREPNKMCWGSIALEGRDWDIGGSATWKITQEDPITLEPSILCTQCGNHGWVRNGAWIPA